MDPRTDARRGEPRARYLWLAGACHLVLIALLVAHLASKPHALGGASAEALVRSIVVLWCAGEAPYGTMEHVPALTNPYGPVFLALCRLLPSGPECGYLPGRLISVASAAVLCLACAVWVRRRGAPLSVAVVTAALLLTARGIYEYTVLYRVDLLATALATAGFLWVVGGWNRRGWVVAGALCLGLATAAKVSVIAAPVACIVWLWSRSRGHALLVAGCWLAVTLAVAAWVQQASDGAYFESIRSFAPRNYAKALEMMARPFLTGPLWAAAVAVLWRRASGPAREAARAEMLWAACALVVAGFSAMNPGSSWNYLTEFAVAASLLTASLLSSSLGCPDGSPPGGSPAPWPPVARRAALLVTCHFAFTWLYLGYWYGCEVGPPIARHEAACIAARAHLEGDIAAGDRVAVVDCEAGRDAVLALGARNYLDLYAVPAAKRERLVDDARRGVAEGRLDRVVEAADCGLPPSR